MTQAVTMLRSIALAVDRGSPRLVAHDDLRFFLRCYVWGVAFFLALLS